VSIYGIAIALFHFLSVVGIFYFYAYGSIQLLDSLLLLMGNVVFLFFLFAVPFVNKKGNVFENVR